MRDTVLKDVLARLHAEEHGTPRPLSYLERELVAATLRAVEAAGYRIQKSHSAEG